MYRYCIDIEYIVYTWELMTPMYIISISIQYISYILNLYNTSDIFYIYTIHLIRSISIQYTLYILYLYNSADGSHALIYSISIQYIMCAHTHGSR